MFKAESNHPWKFKALFELLYQNLNTISLKICTSGIYIEEKTNQNLLISVFLPAECFTEYVYTNPEPITAGLGNVVYKDFFKTVKNKDIIVMKIENNYSFEFEQKNNQNNSLHLLSIRFETNQNIHPFDLSFNYTDPIIIKTADLTHLCKSFNNTHIKINKKKGCIYFSVDTGLFVKSLKIGEENENNTDVCEEQVFFSEQFNRITKLGSFADQSIEVYFDNENPLYLLCKSCIGIVKLFIYPQKDE
jgi:hypothetical protein